MIFRFKESKMVNRNDYKIIGRLKKAKSPKGTDCLIGKINDAPITIVRQDDEYVVYVFVGKAKA
jgi:hypothetical protein